MHLGFSSTNTHTQVQPTELAIAVEDMRNRVTNAVGDTSAFEITLIVMRWDLDELGELLATLGQS